MGTGDLSSYESFEKFPFPTNADSLESIGQRYYTHRQSIMLTRQEGLIDTYNRFHNPNEHAPDIVQLRELHKEMDEAVARAYGWEDLRLEHGFHETKQGLRYTISEEARREVLDRLLLNHQRHAEEVAAGLVDESGKPLKGKAKGKKGAQEKRETKSGRGKMVAADGDGLWGLEVYGPCERTQGSALCVRSHGSESEALKKQAHLPAPREQCAHQKPAPPAE